MSRIMQTAIDAATSVAQVAEVFHRSMRGLPPSSDGLYNDQASPRTSGKEEDEAFLLKAVTEISEQMTRGLPISPAAIPSIVDAVMHAKSHQGIDDRKLLLEHILAFMSRIPPGSLQNRVQDAVIGLFYEALPHPPVDFLPSMAVEAKIPTVIGGKQIGPGGVGVSHGEIGGAKVVCGGEGDPHVFGINGIAAHPHTPPSLAGTYVSPPGQTQTPTPAPSRITGPGEAVGHAYYNANSTRGGKTPTTTERKAYSTMFRTPSGALNNPHMPLLGAAGTAYARSVPSLHALPPSSLPDPELVFDLLMKRRPLPEEANPKSPRYDPRIAAEYLGQGHGQPHPSGLSTLMFAFADIIIHSLFRTSTADPSINLTSSYLDLSPLYGVDEVEMAKVRRLDGTGRLFEDVWADPRISMMPPAVSALLVLFCRNHNFIALRLLEINEKGGYKIPAREPPTSNDDVRKDLFPELSEAKLAWQDDDIFNRARLINCAFFMNAILGDYLSGILGTFREASEWCLNPLEECRRGGKTIIERAEGNCASVEFNLLYRWHATLTPKDEQWLEGAIRRMVPDGPISQQISNGNFELTEEQFAEIAKAASMRGGSEPKTWKIGGLSRTKDGRFADYDLARIMYDATTTMACAYGARGIPAVMKPVEIMGIKQARKWGTCTMNEFRKFVGLKQYESFEEWNPTGDIAATARSLYQHIDNLELYVGLMCEESKQPGDGAGLCPGYTISRAILADAVCLTRGDRFLTTDLTPFALTSWGYQDCARDTKNGSMGGMICKLLFRTLPDYYKEGSVYAHFPFITPGEMKKWLIKMNLIDRYNFDTVPSLPVRPVIPVNSAKGVERVLKDMRTFRPGYAQYFDAITDGEGSFMSFDEEPRHHLGRAILADTLYRDGAVKSYSDFFRIHMRDMIHEKSFSIGGRKRTVNIVRDVINVIPVHWISEEIAGFPLKSIETPRGIMNEQEIYGKLTCIFSFLFLNTDPEESWTLRENATKYADVFREHILQRLQAVGGWQSRLSFRGIKGAIVDSFLHHMTGESDHSDAFYEALLGRAASGLTVDQLAHNVLALAVYIVAQFTHATTNVLDFYLKPENEAHRSEIEHLAVEHTQEADALLSGYVREALRLDPQIPGVLRTARSEFAVEEGNGIPAVRVQQGDSIFVSVANANKDPTAFPNPYEINPRRARESYYVYGRHEFSFFDELLVESMIPSAIRSIFSLKNVRRGPGYTGELNKFRRDIHGSKRHLYISNTGVVTPWPASLMIEYDI